MKNIIKEIIEWVFSLFKKPTGVLPIKVTGSGDVYTPSISMNGNWLPYMTKPYETQYQGFDQLNCVTKSGMHCIEAVLNYFYKNRLFPIPEMYTLLEKGGFLNANGDVDLSERFTAKMAGTTKQGLGMDDFWASINRDGIVPKTVYPDPVTMTWEEYYKPVPQAVIEAGKRSAKIFQWNWKVEQNNNWNAPVVGELKKVLQQSPIHFCGPLCPKDNAGIFRYCGAKAYQHARTLTSLDDYQEILDQYYPFLQKAELAYPIPCAIKMSLKIT